MTDLPQRLRENVTLEYNDIDDLMTEAADRIEADEALMRQALEYIKEVDYGPYDSAPLVAALRERLGEKP